MTFKLLVSDYYSSLQSGVSGISFTKEFVVKAKYCILRDGVYIFRNTESWEIQDAIACYLSLFHKTDLINKAIYNMRDKL